MVVLTVTTIASLIKSKRDPETKAHAGSLRNHPAAEPEPRATDPPTRLSGGTLMPAGPTRDYRRSHEHP